jgi:lipopolysaccharide/colanic/teichoic acid biosynthesis glycosyltransferase
VDRAIALTLLILSAPVLFVAMLLVKLTSRGPVIYRQTRLGLNRRPFILFKLRTMTQDCEKLTGARWAVQNDPRRTPVGGFLRATHIDELPQLWNVVRGDMSLVGPRPERPEIIDVVEPLIPRYAERLSVMPGLTGLAQVQLPPDTDLDSVRRKLVYDLHYINNATLYLDLRIVLATVVHVLHLPFALSRLLLRIPGETVVEHAPHSWVEILLHAQTLPES